MSTTREPADGAPTGATAARRAVRRTALVIAATAVLAMSAVALGTALGRDTRAGSPTGTVRDFLIVAAVDRNSVVACRYLTAHAVRRVENVEPPHTSCEIALSAARLRLGGRVIDQESAVKGLTYRVEQRGTRAGVTVSADDGAALTFGLRRATATERDEFQAPTTLWRIDSGVERLVG
jgi:hypothetical protein